MSAVSLPLDGEGDVFEVAADAVMLFAASVSGGSARRPVGMLGAGALMFGAPPGLIGDETILVIAAEEGAWRRCAWPQDATALADRSAGIAQWIATLAQGIGAAVEPKPRADLLLPNGRTDQSVAAGDVVAVHGDPLWIDLGDTAADLFGIEEVHGLVPLASGAWLRTVTAGALRIYAWQEGLARDDAQPAIARFNAAIQDVLPLVRGFADADELNRIRSQELAERQDRVRIAADLAATIAGTAPAAAGPREGLIDIVRLVGRAEGLTIRRPTRAIFAQQDVEPTLDEIARASGFRLQPVRLTDRWWREDYGPLVGARALGGAPVALLRRRGGYVAIDEAGMSRTVDATAAGELVDRAHALVRPFAARPPALGDLLRLGGRGGAVDVATLALAILSGSLLGQVLPRAIGFVFGELVPAGLDYAILQVAAIVLLAGGVAFAFQVALGAARQRMEARGIARVHAATWDRVLQLPLLYLFARPPAELTAQVGAVLSTQAGMRGHAVAIAAATGAVSSSLVLIVAQWPVAGLIALGVVLVELAAAGLVGWRLGLTQSGEQAEGNADSMMFQIVGGIAKLRLAGAEDRAALRWADRFVEQRRRRVAILRLNNLYDSGVAGFAILAAAGLYTTLATLGSGANGGGYPVALVVTILSAFGVVLTSANQLAHAILGIWTLQPSWRFARSLLDVPPEPLDQRADPGPLRGAIEVSQLAFRYTPDTPPILQDVSFSIAPGQFVAVVGASGSGKSTLLRLILGLQAPLSGAVYVDGRDVATLHPEIYRRQLGVVLQDTRLPAGSIGDIVRGMTEADESQIWDALAAVALRDEVSAMPMGLHTLVTDDGGTLSGGQQQRIALARVLLQQPAVLLLDEPTSALDGATQAAAMASVLASSATRLVIAHRISTIREADLILVLDQGRIVQAGRFADLAATPGPFATLINEDPATTDATSSV